MEGVKPKKRVQRVQLACLPCRQGKLKCNREYPVCDQCFKRSREASCVYSEKGLRYNTAKQKEDSMREKVDLLEVFVNRIRESQAGSATSTASAALESDEGAMNKDPAILIGNLRLSDTGGTQYVGPGHWESIIEDIADVKAYFESEDSPDAASRSDGSEHLSVLLPMNVTFGLSPGYMQPDIISLLPPKSELDRYIATWFHAPDSLSDADVLMVILHGPTFETQYKQFWIDSSSTHPGWLALLLGVTSVGAEIAAQTYEDPVIGAKAEELRRLSSYALLLADYTVPQPNVVEAMMFLVKGLLFKHQDTTRAIWHLHGVVMRSCWLSGYHRDPGNNLAISVLDGEMRRRVWMLAAGYDILTCQQLGMTSVVNQKLCDTAAPANRLDTDFSIDHLSQSRGPDEYTPMLFALQYFKLVRIMGDVALMIGAALFPETGEVESQRLRIEAARTELPLVLRFAPIDQSFTDSTVLILDRFRLEILYKKAYCILYQPYLGKSGFKEQQVMCLSAAEDLVRLSNTMAEACQPGGQFAGFRVHIRRHIHDFTLAAMLLCSEIKRDLASTTPQFSMRVRPLLVQACARWIMIGVTSPKARHAITAIEKFLLHHPKGPGRTLTAENAGPVTINAHTADGVTAFGPTDSEDPWRSELGVSQETFNIAYDPLFLDLFGPTSSVDEYIETGWPD